MDFEKVAASGIDFLVLKCSESSGKDSTFERNYTNSKGLFKGVGCYIFNRATTVAAAEKEAQFAVKCLAGKQMDFGVWLDIETTALRTLGKVALNAVIDTEAAILQKAGFKVGVYTGYAWYKSVIDVEHIIARYPLWLARYANDGYYHESLSTKHLDGVFMWQYSGHGKVEGIKGNVDMDITYCPPEMWWDNLLDVSNYSFKNFIMGLQRVYNLPLTGVADDALFRATTTVSMSVNSRTAVVKHLQRYLNCLGYSCGVADGVAGKSFHKAICDYQSKIGLAADGIVSAQGKTWRALLGMDVDTANGVSEGISAGVDKNQCIGDIQKALGVAGTTIDTQKIFAKTITVSKSKNNRHAVVKPLQELLNVLGYNCGKADGVAGNSFDKAVRKFQKDNNLVCDGEITARGNTWKALLSVKN